MESIGEKLRLAREANNLTLEQVSRETHVAKRFLKALEDEEFSAFPGETYAMGFLRNYADYLGMDAEELIGLYRTLKIQEQPLPMTELLDVRSTRRPLLLAGAIVVGAIVLFGAGFLVYRAVVGRAPAQTAVEPLREEGPQEFLFEGEVRTKWFGQGDVISVPLGGATYRVEVGRVADRLTLRVPGGTVELELGKERPVDLDGDAAPDMRIVWNDADRASAAARANLGLSRTEDPGVPATAVASSPAAPAASPSAAPLPAPARRVPFAPIVLARAASTDRFVLDFMFKNDCLFRFLADDGEREDRFFQKGEVLTLDAKGRIVVWISNAGAVRVRYAGRDFEIGRLGEVATRSVEWRADSAAGGYVLEVTPLR